MALPQIGFADLFDKITYSADGAISISEHHALLDSSAANCQMTLAAPGAARIGSVIPITAVDVSNTVDVDYTDATGAVTQTFTTVGETIYLMATSATTWTSISNAFNALDSAAHSTTLNAVQSAATAASTANSSALSASVSVGVQASSGLSATQSAATASSTANSSALSATTSVGVQASSGLSATQSVGTALGSLALDGPGTPFMFSKTLTSSAIVTGGVVISSVVGTADVEIDEIILETDATGLATGTDVRITDIGTPPATAVGAAIKYEETVANLGALVTENLGDGSVVAGSKFILPVGGRLGISSTGLDCTGAGTIKITVSGRRVGDGATISAA